MTRRCFFIVGIIVLTLISLCSARKLPVVAILANPEPDNAVDITRSRVNAQYVHWLEQSLADVVVIHPWYTEHQIDEILSKVNGVLFPGGDRNLTLNGQFEKVTQMIVNKIISKFDNEGVSVPLWGTCQGFELLHVLIADTLDVLTSFEANNIQTPLIVNKETINQSRMFSDFDKEDLSNLQNKNTTAQFHHFGVSEEQYHKFPRLKEFYRITTFGEDLNGKNYIASIEGNKYPFYAVQFHPEMVAYTKIEVPGVPQSMEAVRISQLLGNFFLKQVRRLNKNQMTPEDLQKFNYINSFSQLPERSDNGGYYYYYFNKEVKSFLK